MNRKHIREAIRAAGLKLSEVTITRHGKHPHLLLASGQIVVCSITPTNPHIAGLRLARDLRRATQGK